MVGLQNLKNFEIKGGFTVESHCSFTQWLPSSRSTFFSVSDPHKIMRIRIQDPDPLFFYSDPDPKGEKLKKTT